jgi:hypothetical protein
MTQTGGKQQPNQIVLWSVLGVFVLGCAIYIYLQFSSSSAPAPVAVSVPANTVPAVKTTGTAAKNLGTTSAQLDPTLRMAAMLVTEALVYSGNGRNIFSASSVPVIIDKPIAPARPKPGPPPPPPPPPGPPPPPPIDLKFFGTASSPDGKRQAFLLHGDDVFLASDGDIVQRKYKVISISTGSILVEDLANSNRQTLPLLAR